MSSPSDLIAQKEKELEELREEQRLKDEAEAKAAEEARIAAEKEAEEQRIADELAAQQEAEANLSVSDELTVEGTASEETASTTSDIINELSNDTSTSIEFNNEAELPSYNSVPTEDPIEPIDEFPEDIFVGANCPKCQKMLGHNTLIRSQSSREIAYYRCNDDGYVAIRSH